MRTAHFLLGTFLCLASISGVPAQADPPQASLSLDEASDALVFKSNRPGAVYAIVAGLNQAHIPLRHGLVLTVAPELILISGVLNDSGKAFVPIQLESEAFAGDEVHFQGAVWSFLPDDVFPDQLTNRVTAKFRDPVTERAPGTNGEEKPVLRVVDLSADFDPSVQLLSTDSIPPIYSIRVETKVQGLEAKMAVVPLDHDRGEGVVLLSAELIALGPSEDSKAKEVQIISAGRELGSEIREIEVRFSSRTANSDVGR